jgi:DNA-binding PadR family transcriptional regulator
MSLEYAILGFLNHNSYSGYDLKRIFDTSVRHFWPADQSQIYRTLSRMSEKGWVEIEVIRQEARPDRKLYHITPGGREELRHWLLTTLPPEEIRSADMIQVFFAAQLSDEEILGIFERAAGLMRSGLEQYAQIPRNIEAYRAYTNSPREFFFWLQTLDIGIDNLQSSLKFIENLIERIRNGEIPRE